MPPSDREYDVVMIGDFRFPGGTSTAVASEIDALSAAGYRIGLLPFASRILNRARAFHPLIAAALASGRASLVPFAGPTRAGLVVLHHPQVFGSYPVRPWNLSADASVLVVHHPPVDAQGRPLYDWAAIDRTVRTTLGPTFWAPVGPKVRAAFAGLADRPPLLERDWVNTLDAAAWRGNRTGLVGDRPVIGRHSRPDKLKWPETAEAMRMAYPDDPRLSVRLMGYEGHLDAALGQRPPNWEVLPFDAEPVPEFLRRLDFFVYYHHPDWIEAFGRAILEAMATGAVPVLPPDFEPVFGDGAVYAEIGAVRETVLSHAGDPAAFRESSRAAEALVARRYDARVAVDRVQNLIGAPVARPPARPRRKPRALFFTSNGVGMGHLVRSLGVARRLKDRLDPAIVTLSKAFAVAEADGIHAEYLPFSRHIDLDVREWNVHLAAEMTEILAFHQPEVLIFDGNVPYQGLLDAKARFPQLWSVWMRRGMWAPDSGKDIITREDKFDAVIEPGELAAPFDRGLTRDRRDRTRLVAPMRYLREGEALGRVEARLSLGIPPDCTAVLLQLGSGNNFDRDLALGLLLRRLAAEPEVRVYYATWRIEHNAARLPPGVERLTLFPYARYLAAFDVAFAAAGYNTFHENIFAALPTVFVPNESPEQDEQLRRGQYAELCGIGRVARASVPQEVARIAGELLDPDARLAIAEACRALDPENGADAAADFIAELAFTRRPHD